MEIAQPRLPFIPGDARWYLAELVVEFVIGGDKKLVHINMVLVEAASPEEAYERAIVLGKDHEIVYTNTDGKSVVAVFRGLRDLNVIHGQLEHGTELIYERLEDPSADEIAGLLSPRSELGVFSDQPA